MSNANLVELVRIVTRYSDLKEEFYSYLKEQGLEKEEVFVNFFFAYAMYMLFMSSRKKLLMFEEQGLLYMFTVVSEQKKAKLIQFIPYKSDVDTKLFIAHTLTEFAYLPF